MKKVMNKNVDINLLIAAEKIRHQTDYSSAHWFHQVLCVYETGISNKLRLEAFESVIRAAISSGVPKAIELAKTYPPIAGFPDYLFLGDNDEVWREHQKWAKCNSEILIKNRFGYLRDGD